jgi:hypothetical protein
VPGQQWGWLVFNNTTTGELLIDRRGDDCMWRWSIDGLLGLGNSGLGWLVLNNTTTGELLIDLVVLDRIGAKSFRNMLVRSFIKI